MSLDDDPVIIDDVSEMEIVNIVGITPTLPVICLHDEEDVVVTMETNKQKPKRKRKRTNGDCLISHVSHDPSHDFDIQYVSTNTKETKTTSKSKSKNSSPAKQATPTIQCPPSSSTPSTTHLSVSSLFSPILSLEPIANVTSSSTHATTTPISQKSRDQEACLFITSSSAPQAISLDVPKWWMEPENDGQLNNFMLVNLDIDSNEASLVATPLMADGFKVISVNRVQSPRLWRRYMGEVRLLLEERGTETNLNEKLLYHCTQTNKEVICTEGLDLRLSKDGNFGRGIYFSDKPVKCDGYCRSKKRSLFACKVILGDVKIYPSGINDRTLTREPKKEDGTYYDSVAGFMSIGEEYIIYNNYRSLPMYYVEYTNKPKKKSTR